METTMFSETLVNTQHSMQLMLDSRSYTLNSSRDNLRIMREWLYTGRMLARVMAFVWMDWAKPQQTSVRIGYIQAEIGETHE
jgi:hypothetical protein